MLSNFHSVEVELKHLKFSGAKTLEKFPYSLSAEFKRRKTSTIGERTAMEFYSDIAYMFNVYFLIDRNL